MHNDDENIPYNDNIDYIIVDIKLFIFNINQYFHENINIKDKKVIKLLKYDKKYDINFLKKLIDDNDIEYIIYSIIKRTPDNEYLINLNMYKLLILKLEQRLYIKFLNIMVDDNYLKLKFDQEKFIWTNLKGTIIYEN